MLLNILLGIEIVVSLCLTGVVLLQRSEGGGLVSGGTGSLISVRGAGDLLTRTTWILGSIFFVLALLLTIVSGRERGGASVVDRLKVNAINPAELQKQPVAPPAGQPGQDGAAPSPFQAPTPTINSPFGSLPAQSAPAPAVPAAPEKK